MKLEYSNFDEFVNDLEKNNYKALVMCGLPGSGKSSLALKLESEGYNHLSSDKARVEVLKLTKGKFASGAREYKSYKSKVYEYIRKRGLDLLRKGEKVVFDATHLNEQRTILLENLRQEGYGDSFLVVYVDGGDKDNISRRFENMSGRNTDGRSWLEAWETAYDYFVEGINSGEITIPKRLEKRFKVITVKNY